MKTDKEILSQAIEQYGLGPQLDMLIEEMAELTQAICKVKRNRQVNIDRIDTDDHGNQNFYNIHEEFADVQIVMAQIESCLSHKLLSIIRKTKLTRLNNKLNPK